MEDYSSSRCKNCSFRVTFFDNIINIENKKVFCSKTCYSSFLIKNNLIEIKNDEFLIKYTKIF